MKTFVTALLVLQFAIASFAIAEEKLRGRGFALDGDTIELAVRDRGTVRIRLSAISAPEMDDWPIGAMARNQLDAILRESDVICIDKGKRSHKRVVATCELVSPDPAHHLSEVKDIGARMLASGWAVSHRAYFNEIPGRLQGLYYLLEGTAADARLGIWGR